MQRTCLALIFFLTWMIQEALGEEDFWLGDGLWAKEVWFVLAVIYLVKGVSERTVWDSGPVCIGSMIVRFVIFIVRYPD